MNEEAFPQIRDWPLPYVGQLESRPVRQISGLVVHCTELPDLAEARRYGEQQLYPSGTGNSGHFYIDLDGSIHRFVPPERVAHHVRDHNRDTLGIELINLGRWPHWLDSRHQEMSAPYPDVQIDALIALVNALATQLPSLRWICGHEELDQTEVAASDNPLLKVRRKRDPGPMFPWKILLERIPLARAAGI